MMRPAHLFLPLIASVAVWGAEPNQPKAPPTTSDVDIETTQPAGKPACTAAIVGHQWPEEAADPIFAAALAPYGYPMVCTHTVSTYVWRSVRPEPKKTDKPVRTVAPPVPKLAARKD